MSEHQSGYMSNSLRTADDYRAAILHLEASTQATETHSALIESVVGDTTNDRSTQPNNAAHLQHKTSNNPRHKHDQLSSLIASQHTSLSQSLTTTSIALSKSIAVTLITIEDTLSRHDHTFTQLDKTLDTASQFKETDPDTGLNRDVEIKLTHDVERARVSKLLNALESIESKVISTRLERTFLETRNPTATASTSRSTRATPFDDDRNFLAAETQMQAKLDGVRQDLRTLNAEIPSLSTMLVAHEHGDQLNAMNDRVDQARRLLRARQASWTLSQIARMTGELEEMREKAVGLYGHRLVIEKLKEEVDAFNLGSGMSRGSGASEGDKATSGRLDGPQLIALRSYLGRTGVSREKRIGDGFREVKGEIGRSLDGQERQVGVLKGKKDSLSHGGEEERDDIGLQRDSNIDYGLMLDDLDGEIAKIKEAIEQLPG